MLTSSQIGYIGCSLYSFIFVLCLWRSYVHLVPYYPPWYSTRKIFHITLLCYAGLQAVSFIVFCKGSNTYDKWSYTCHLLGIWTETLAFTCLSVLWSKTLLSNKKSRIFLFPSLIVIDCVLLIYLIVLINDMFTSPLAFSEWSETSNLFTILLIIEPIVLTSNGIVLGILGVLILIKLTSHPSMKSIEEKSRASIKRVLITTLVSCSLCFGVRSSLEIVVYLHKDGDISQDMWWIASTWCPTIIPALILLYTLVICVYMFTLLFLC
jgi:hypothetical protein